MLTSLVNLDGVRMDLQEIQELVNEFQSQHLGCKAVIKLNSFFLIIASGVISFPNLVLNVVSVNEVELLKVSGLLLDSFHLLILDLTMGFELIPLAIIVVSAASITIIAIFIVVVRIDGAITFDRLLTHIEVDDLVLISLLLWLPIKTKVFIYSILFSFFMVVAFFLRFFTVITFFFTAIFI